MTPRPAAQGAPQLVAEDDGVAEAAVRDGVAGVLQ
jgi:hypothetical protein